EPLIGFFVNTLALRVRLEDNPSVAALLSRVKADALNAYAHQDLPFEQVVEALQPPRSLSHSPIFQVMLALDNTPVHNLELPGLTIEPLEPELKTTHFDLSLSLNESEQGLSGSLVYASDLFDKTTIQRLAGQLERVLTAMVADEQQRVQELALLSTEERQQVLVDFNATAAPYPQHALIHQLFEQQAARAPAAIALR
ncbi:condensation domain-containing protein, partial [Neisseriaceae bacterium TC5R-5]|nr:condensation domain-containing protein [Neisseriaceae bacterium TC5R-5]